MIDEQALHAIRPELASLMKAAEECKIDFCIDTRKELTPYVKALLQSIEQGSGSEAEGAMGSKEILLREVRSAIFALGWNSEIESFSRPIEPRSFMDTLKWKMLWQDGLVGQGTYARVVKAKNLTNESLVAIKSFRWTTVEDVGLLSNIVREISILRELSRCPNVIQLLDVLKIDGQIHLIFEWREWDLHRYLQAHQQVEEQSIASVMHQILNGLRSLHLHGVIHRDLKPGNILLDSSAKDVKIADFGLSRAILPGDCGHHILLTKEVVTLNYRAPELLLGCQSYDEGVDMWSVGCIFAEIALGVRLFDGDSEIDTLFKIFGLLGTPDDELWPGVSDLPEWQPVFPRWRPKAFETVFEGNLSHEAIGLLQHMLRLDPKKRIGTEQAMQHPFFDLFRREHEIRIENKSF